MRNIVLTLALVSLPALVSAQAVSGRSYVMQAGASDLFEKQSSELVMASTKNQKVRQFAHDMVRDHTKSTADIKAAATATDMKPMPPNSRLTKAVILLLCGLPRARIAISCTSNSKRPLTPKPSHCIGAMPQAATSHS